MRGKEPGVKGPGEPWGETQAAGLGPSREGACEGVAGTLGGLVCRARRVDQALVSLGACSQLGCLKEGRRKVKTVH